MMISLILWILFCRASRKMKFKEWSPEMNPKILLNDSILDNLKFIKIILFWSYKITIKLLIIKKFWIEMNLITIYCCFSLKIVMITIMLSSFWSVEKKIRRKAAAAHLRKNPTALASERSRTMIALILSWSCSINNFWPTWMTNVS